MQRILNKRLTRHFETNNLFTPTQTGYRCQRITEDQLTLFVLGAEKKKVVGVFFDLSKAFDRGVGTGTLWDDPRQNVARGSPTEGTSKRCC